MLKNFIKEDLKKLNNFSISLKNHLPLIIIIPTIMGGIWQVIELLRFGLPYIRFFSITQLVSDGLIMLFIIPIIIVITYLIFRSINYLHDLKASEDVYSTSVVSGIIVFFIIRYFVLSSPKYEVIDNYPPMVEFIIIASAFAITLVLVKNSDVFSLWNKKLLDEVKNVPIRGRIKNIFKKSTFKIAGNFFGILIAIVSLMFCIVFYLFISVKTILSIGNNNVPNDLFNIEIVENSVERNFNIKKEDFNISYYNDSYIFIKYYKNSKKERDSLRLLKKSIPSDIIILKAEVFFENNNLN